MGGDYRTWHLPEGVRARLGKGSLGKDGQVEDGMMALSSDGRCLAVATAIGVWLYEVAEARPLALLPSSHPVLSVALSREGLLAAGLDDGHVVLWEVATGEQVGHLQHAWSGVSSVVFSGMGPPWPQDPYARRSSGMSMPDGKSVHGRCRRTALDLAITSGRSPSHRMVEPSHPDLRMAR